VVRISSCDGELSVEVQPTKRGGALSAGRAEQKKWFGPVSLGGSEKSTGYENPAGSYRDRGERTSEGGRRKASSIKG